MNSNQKKVLLHLKTKIVPTLQRHGVVKASLFGSVVSGSFKKTSDIDILVAFEAGKSLFDLVDLEYALSRSIHRKVDIVTFGSLHPLLKNSILAEQVHIL